MKDVVDAFLARHTVRWVEGVEKHARAISILSVVATLALGAFAAVELKINSDNVRMLADTLPSKIAHAQFARHFPNLDDALLIVIDGETPELAREATETLAKRLREQKENFTEVYIPGGGSFFERNGLLYRSLDELDEFADQMARLQPVLAQLESDPSIESLASIVHLGLDAVRSSGSSGEEWSMILNRVGDATVTIFDEFPIAVSWEEVLLRGSSIDVANRRVIVAHPILDFDAVLAAGHVLDAIRDTATALSYEPNRGVTVRITGNPALNYEEMVGLAWDIGGAGFFCFLLVCGVLYIALRSWRLVIAAVATLLMGLVWTAAFAAATVHQLNLLSLSFGVLFIGLGVDFAIHLGMRYADALAAGTPHSRALGEATADVGSSLVLCTITTAIGFYVFLPSDYRGVAELGLIAGSGMFIILAVTLTTLPALLTGWLRIDSAAPRIAKLRFDASWLHRLDDNPGRIRWAAALAGLLGLALLAWPGAHFDSNVIRMRNPTTESVQAFDDLMEMNATSPWYANVVAPDLDAADAAAQRLEGYAELVDRAVTLSDYVPENQEEKLEILADVAMLLEAPRPAEGAESGSMPSPAEQIEALRDLADFLGEGWVEGSTSSLAGSMRLLRERLVAFLERIDRGSGDEEPEEALAILERVLLSRLPNQIARLRRALEAEEIARDDLPAELVARMLSPTGQARVQIFPKENLQDTDALNRFIESIRRVDPLVSGVSVNLYDFGRATVSSFQRALVLALVLISILLGLLWRNAGDVLLVLSPLLLSAVLTVATMAAVDIRFNFANVIVLPLLFGIGVDSGIHLVHRAKLGAVGRHEMLLGTTTARAVFYSAVTTVVSFGTLAFSSHRGVASLGVLLTVGMLLTVACNLIVLPALLDLRERRDA